MFVSFRFPMETLKRDRKITVYLPDDYYQSKKQYPVLYIQDGQNAFFDRLSYTGVSWGFLDYAQFMNLDMIMVAIPCNFAEYKREDEYGPWVLSDELSARETNGKRLLGGEGKKYAEWLVNDLKPYIDQRFQTDVHNCGIVGSSMGAIISTYVTLKYPNVFSKCAALSTAFWMYMDEFEGLIQESDLSAVEKFYFDLGEFEGCGDKETDEWYIESNNMIYGMLKEKIPQLEYHFFENETHNEAAWRERVPLFMDYLFGE